MQQIPGLYTNLKPHTVENANSEEASRKIAWCKKQIGL